VSSSGFGKRPAQNCGCRHIAGISVAFQPSPGASVRPHSSESLTKLQLSGRRLEDAVPTSPHLNTNLVSPVMQGAGLVMSLARTDQGSQPCYR
jgi:hypothetical protein